MPGGEDEACLPRKGVFVARGGDSDLGLDISWTSLERSHDLDSVVG
jgi:hypothetical protein